VLVRATLPAQNQDSAWSQNCANALCWEITRLPLRSPAPQSPAWAIVRLYESACDIPTTSACPDQPEPRAASRTFSRECIHVVVRRLSTVASPIYDWVRAAQLTRVGGSYGRPTFDRSQVFCDANIVYNPLPVRGERDEQWIANRIGVIGVTQDMTGQPLRQGFNIYGAGSQNRLRATTPREHTRRRTTRWLPGCIDTLGLRRSVSIGLSANVSPAMPGSLGLSRGINGYKRRGD